MADQTAFLAFVDKLKKRLQKPLPGFDAQLKMAPEGREEGHRHQHASKNAKKGGVLILLYPHREKINLVLTRRVNYGGVHGGQVSLPGGRIEEGDVDILHTALRETEEEVGIATDTMEVIGTISQLYIPPSNFLVTPVVAMTSERPVMRADPEEVDEILEVTIDDLLNTANHTYSKVDVMQTFTIQAPCFYVKEHVVWGATAMILSEFVDVLREMDSSQ